jgi:predicted enzyme related to lactoylglutathione lyase
MILLNIDVPDLAAAERFYTEAFGLVTGRRFGTDFIEMLGWPVPLYLLRKEPGTIGAGAQARSYARHWTPVHLDVVVEDLDAATVRAARAGARVEQAPQDVAFGRIARVADPFGHGFCLIEFSARGYDALL